MLVETATIKNLIDGEQGDMGLLCQHIESVCDAIQQNLKAARRRVPREFLTATSPNEANLGLNKDWYEQIATCYQHASKLMRTLQDLSKSALQTILTSGGIKVIVEWERERKRERERERERERAF